MDGRGPSAWDEWSRTPGRIIDGTTPALAADFYHRYDGDVALMERLGVHSYRFSLSWSRIIPNGRGKVNAAGLDFYDRLVDRLLAGGIAPMASLIHFDLPQALEQDGGWLNRDTVEAFAEYADVVGARLADRVESWVPVDAPNLVMLMGYALGRHAPGWNLLFDSLPTLHHQLLAHGRGAIILRSHGARQVGCANNHAPMWPSSEAPEDVGATKLFDALFNGSFMEPMLLGRYPADMAPLMEEIARDGDMATIRQPLDFYGVDYFHPLRVGAASEESDALFELREVVGHPVTDQGWPMVPMSLREQLVMMRARFRAALPPIIVTESGGAFSGDPDERGVVADDARIDYIRSHLLAVQEAVVRGVDVREFHVRSLLDGFEWTDGHTQRFGLVHVDHETMERTPKRSFEWYAEQIAAQPQHA